MMGIYVASKSCHGPMWQDYRRRGFDIHSTWIDESGEGETGDWPSLWARCVTEAAAAAQLIAYHEPSEEWKGAFIEIGAALANGVSVILVGDPPGSWKSHQLVERASSLNEAFSTAVARNPHLLAVRVGDEVVSPLGCGTVASVRGMAVGIRVPFGRSGFHLVEVARSKVSVLSRPGTHS